MTRKSKALSTAAVLEGCKALSTAAVLEGCKALSTAAVPVGGTIATVEIKANDV